jgi:fluoroquinolone transport system permease protein
VTLAGAAPRLRGLMITELRLLARMWVLASAAVVTVLWGVAIQFVPDAARAIVLPLILLMDLAALGFFFIPSLVVLERAEGIWAAMRVTPARAGERLAIRVGALTAASLGAAAILGLAAGQDELPVVLLGVASTSVTFALCAYIMVGPFDTLTGYMVRVPVVAVPLLLPALIDHLGVWDGWPLHLTPVTGQMELMSGHASWVLVGWQAAWIAALWAIALGAVTVPLRTRAAVGRRTARPAGPRAGPFSTWGAIRSFARADRATLLRDPLVVMIAIGVPAVAVVARLISTVGVEWIRNRFGIDITPYLPVVWAMLLVVHTPLLFGSLVGLLLLEDRDAGLLPVLATTRASTSTLLVYRLGALVLATAVMTPIGFAIAGVEHPAGWMGLLATSIAAAALAPLPALVMAALAPNRAAGMALMKIIGLPIYLPLAAWFVGFPPAAAFAIVPSSWAIWSSWAGSASTSMMLALIGVVVCAIVSAWLLRRPMSR